MKGIFPLKIHINPAVKVGDKIRVLYYCITALCTGDCTGYEGIVTHVHPEFIDVYTKINDNGFRVVLSDGDKFVKI